MANQPSGQGTKRLSAMRRGTCIKPFKKQLRSTVSKAATNITFVHQCICVFFHNVHFLAIQSYFILVNSTVKGLTIDNEYYVTGMGNTFTVLIQMYSVTSTNLKPCVLNVNEFF